MLIHLRISVMTFAYIPGFERYMISVNGTVLDTVDEVILQDQDNVSLASKVNLLYKNRTNRYRSVSVARLILITHRPIPNIDLSVVWGPKLKDPHMSQITASNLDYDFGDYIPPTPTDAEEFFFVPGFIDTEINLNGVVKMSGKESKLGDQRGYTVASARLPSGKSVTVGRHRLMALTFLQHPINCSDLIVNHKNGKPSEDEINNLEWVTYRGNIVHAHDTDLVKNHNPIEVKNNFTGEITEFFSIGAFSRHYDLNQREIKRLEFRLRNFKVVSDYRGFSIKLKNYPVRWDELERLDQYKGNAKEVLLKNTETDEVKEFLWFKDAAEFLGVSQYRLLNKLRQFGEVIIGKYSVSFSKPSILAGNSK